jgi:tRNA(Ile)-lysidine synthase
MNAAISPLSHDILIATLRRFLNRIPGPCRLLVAVSGGSDSKGLLIALHSLLPQHPLITLVAATIDHGLRAESAAEAQEVADLCARMGVDHIIRRWVGPKPTTGLSAASRNARYRLLAEAATALGANVIVTGHTVDDQIETITMRQHRSRAEDAPGLSGMAERVLYHNQIWIYRPVLTCRRQVIRDFLTAQGMGWVDDPSNTNSHYERARVRATLAQTANAPVPALYAPARQNRTTLSRQAATLITTSVRKPAAGVIAINMDALQAPPPVLRHALQALVATLGGQNHGPADQSLTQLLTMFQRACGARITLGRCLAHRHRQGLLLVREARGLPTIIIAPDETAVWDGRWQIHNAGLTELHVTKSASKPPHDTSGLPASIIALGHQSLPQLHRQGEALATRICTDAQCQPIISQYSDFLPGFDWPLACVLANLFEAKSFFPPDF